MSLKGMSACGGLPFATRINLLPGNRIALVPDHTREVRRALLKSVMIGIALAFFFQFFTDYYPPLICCLVPKGAVIWKE